MRSAFVLLLLAAVALPTIVAASRPVQRIVLTEDAPVATPRLRRAAAAVSCSLNNTSGLPALTGTCVPLATCVAAPFQTAFPNVCSDASLTCCVQQPEVPGGCGTAALQRASTWVAAQLQYCQSPNGQPDADEDCAPICTRPHNAGWDAYRSDCSALVSFAYAVPAPGRSTYEFAPYNNEVTFQLSSARDLLPGDALNSTPREHIVMFITWTAADRSSAQFFEEPGCSFAQPYARRFESPVVINDKEGTITLQAKNMTFYPIRFYSNMNGC